MARQRDLYRAIVLSAVALVSAPGCDDGADPVDASTVRLDAQSGDSGPSDSGAPVDAPMLADAGSDAGAPVDGGPIDAGSEDAGEDAFVAIL